VLLRVSRRGTDFFYPLFPWDGLALFTLGTEPKPACSSGKR